MFCGHVPRSGGAFVAAGASADVDGAPRTQTIRVLHTEFHGRMLLLDEDVMLTERDEGVYHEMLAHVPLAYLPNVR